MTATTARSHTSMLTPIEVRVQLRPIVRMYTRDW
ncbi:hypothetical protein BDB13_5708 [Rhodococcus sp. OK302]|nr:hypothetical protein BDB13_5708 [Rhodococcus sp. OK302]